MINNYFFQNNRVLKITVIVGPRVARESRETRVPSTPGCPPSLAPASPRIPSQSLQKGLSLTLSCLLTNAQWPVKVYGLNEDQQWDSQDTGHVIRLRRLAEGHVPAS